LQPLDSLERDLLSASPLQENRIQQSLDTGPVTVGHKTGKLSELFG
jgi:hypothetical protein